MKENTTGKIQSQAGSAYKVRKPVVAHLVYTAFIMAVGVLKKIG